MGRSLSPFAAARNMFREHINYSKEYSYEEWAQLKSENKAAALFVQFFEQITLAWYKCKSFYTPEEDGVSTVLQYLQKNVSIIEENPKKFTPNYIYKVAYNCMYCICHDIKRDRLAYENEVSNIIPTDDGDIDLFDTVCKEVDYFEAAYQVRKSDEIWQLVDSLGKDVQKVVDDLMTNTKQSGLSAKRREAAMEILRRELAGYVGA